MTEMTTRLLVLVLYLGLILSVGIYQGREVKSDADYQIGGRSIPGWAAALSERATAESAYCMLGFPGFAYASGMLSIWPSIGLAVGNILAWTVIARKMQSEAEKVEAITYIDWVAKRHSKLQKSVRLIGSFIILFLFMFYVEAQILGGGKTLGSMFGISPVMGMIFTLLIILPYACYGGYQSVVYTDCVQSILMIATLVLGPIFGFIYLANNPDIVYNASVVGALKTSGLISVTGGVKGFASGLAIGNALSWVFAYLGGCPHLNIRFMSIKNKNSIKTARNVGVVWTIVGYIGATLIGFIGIAIFGPNAFADPETIMPQVIMKVMPPALASLMVTAAIAGLVSTADSMLILASSELSEDILKPYILKGEISPRKSLNISRLVTLLIAIVAFGLVFIIPQNLVYGVVSFAWGGLGSSFAVLTLLTCFWKKFNAQGAIASMVVGFLVTLAWYYSPLEKVVTSMFIGVVASLIAAVIVTNLTHGKRASVDQMLTEEAGS